MNTSRALISRLLNLTSKNVLVLVSTSFLTACTSAMTIKYATPIPKEQCEVNVYVTKAQAEKRGEIEELCLIDASPVGGFYFTVSQLIEGEKDKACECGATNVYIQSTKAMEFASGVRASLVGFKYKRLYEE